MIEHKDKAGIEEFVIAMIAMIAVGLLCIALLRPLFI